MNNAPKNGTSASTAPWSLLKQSVSEWSEDKATKLAAALAFYTMLSIAPLLTITIKIVSKVFDEQAAIGKVRGYLTETAGEKGAAATEQMMKAANQSGAGILATIISVAVLLASASGVFGELQDSLNTIWEVKQRPGRGIMGTIKDRFFSMTLVFGTAFLLMVSLVISTVLAGVASHLGGGDSVFWHIVNFIVSLVVLAGLFTLMFRYLPDVRTGWRSVAVGGALTAVFFTVGKFLLGWYLGRASTTSVYGAAGSLVALLLWVYYSAQILFFGAEFTRVYAKGSGDKMIRLPSAVPITEEDRTQQGITPASSKPEAHSAMFPKSMRTRVKPKARSLAVACASGTVGAIAGILAAEQLGSSARAVRGHMAAVNLERRIRAIEAQVRQTLERL